MAGDPPTATGRRGRAGGDRCDIVLDRGPHRGASGARRWAGEFVGREDSVDHVGQHRDPRPTAEPDRHDDVDGTVGPDRPLDRAIDADETGRAAERGDDQPGGTRDVAQGSGGGGESDRGGFHRP